MGGLVLLLLHALGVAPRAGLAGQLGNTVVLSDTLGIGDAVAMAWDLRSRPRSSIRTFTVPTEPSSLADGSYVVRMTTPMRELLEGAID